MENKEKGMLNSTKSVDDKMGQIFKVLKNALDSYDKILLFETEDNSFFSEFQYMSINSQKLLILVSDMIFPVLMRKNITFCQISGQRVRQLKKLYFTYEFSDRFLIIPAKDIRYAGLYDMIDIGILTTQEFLETLLV